MEPQTLSSTNLARKLRVDSIRATAAAGSGHTTSSLSAADLMAVLLHHHFRYDFAQASNPANDHLLFSKGHAAPLLYAMYKAAGVISDEELLSYRSFGSRFEGHPTPTLPWVEVGTGSLGQGLPIGVGIALAGKYLDNLPYRVWVLCGDSEMAEGSMWEAFDRASYYQTSNLIAILDMNRLGQSTPTPHGWNSEVYARRAEAFGWHPITIDGHDVDAIDRAYAEATQPREQPTLIIAQTIKGKGVSFMEDKEGWHGKPPDSEQAAQAIAELGGEISLTVPVASPEPMTPALLPEPTSFDFPAYEGGETVATRQAYGDALRAIGSMQKHIVALDGEVSNSTKSEVFAHAHPQRFFEMFTAEQQMIGAAAGLNVCGYCPFASSFAAFLTRAYDFIRMASISRLDLRLCGSHAGVSIGQDGPSQMGLEDIAMMRSIYDSTVLYPCDGNQTTRLVAAMVDRPGISYLRTTRTKTPVIYPSDISFPIGGSKTLRQSEQDQVTVVAAGITIHEALKAYDALQQEHIAFRLIDAYSVKPIDFQSIKQAVRATGGRLVVVEDHRAEGGLGSAVFEAFALHSDEGEPMRLRMHHLAIRHMPGSGTSQEQLDAGGISARHIATAVRELSGAFPA
jgi:transketolase